MSEVIHVRNKNDLTNKTASASHTQAHKDTQTRTHTHTHKRTEAEKEKERERERDKYLQKQKHVRGRKHASTKCPLLPGPDRLHQPTLALRLWPKHMAPTACMVASRIRLSSSRVSNRLKPCAKPGLAHSEPQLWFRNLSHSQDISSGKKPRPLCSANLSN